MPAKAAKKAAKPAKKPATKAAPKAAPRKAAKPAFGRAGTAGKGEGDGAVQAWLDGVKPEHQELLRRVDAMMGEVPGIQRAVKWSMPMYGLPGKGWVAHLGSFKDYVAVGFFAGAELSPPPPEGSSDKMRRVKIHGPGEFDERQLRSWIRQASQRQGWGRL